MRRTFPLALSRSHEELSCTRRAVGLKEKCAPKHLTLSSIAAARLEILCQSHIIRHRIKPQATMTSDRKCAPKRTRLKETKNRIGTAITVAGIAIAQARRRSTTGWQRRQQLHQKERSNCVCRRLHIAIPERNQLFHRILQYRADGPAR